MGVRGPFIMMLIPADPGENNNNFPELAPAGDELKIDERWAHLVFRGWEFSIDWLDLKDMELMTVSFHDQEPGDDPKWCRDFADLCRVLYNRLKPSLLRTGYDVDIMFGDKEQTLEAIQYIDWIQIWAPAWQKVYPPKKIIGLKDAFHVEKMTDGGWYLQLTELAWGLSESIRQSVIDQLGIELPEWMQ